MNTCCLAARSPVLRILAALLVFAAVTATGGAAVAQDGPTPQSPSDALVDIERGIPFAATPAGPLVLNVYKPKSNETGRPAVVLVHGGSWSQGGPDNMDLQGKLLAQQGWLGFSISYRLAQPGAPPVWPSNLEDVKTAVRWVGDHAREYGADPTRIALIGNSAGGHLSSLVGANGFGLDPASTPDPARAPRVRVVATFSAPLALAKLAPTGGRPPEQCGDNESCKLFWGQPIVPAMLGCEPSQCPDKYDAASFPKQVKPTSAPIFLANATDEIVPLDQLEESLSATLKVNVEAKVVRIPGDRHGSDPGNGYTAKVWNEMMPFLADKLGVPVPQPILFAPDRELKDYVTYVLIGLFGLGLLVVFVYTAVRNRWDEPE